MAMKSVLVALLGIAVAGGSAFGAREYLKQTAATASTDPTNGLVTAIVAGREIKFGQAIEPQMLQIVSWPREALPVGAFTDVDALLPQAGGQPRRAKGSMSPGELILASKVSNFGEKVTIVQTLGANTRAMAIRVDAVTGVGGFVTPGDTVDIVLTQGGGDGLRAVTILQNIRVIGVDQQTNEQNAAPDIARTVTVEVSPEQSQKLALAQSAGTLSLTLRTLDNVVDQPLNSIRLSDILQEKSPTEDEVEKTRIKVRRGNELTEVEINN
ncbi:Flp pilus assembly protein CpaB [Defluviimonas sp. WL0075]|uniref:Flp pilus assembly protein CpaB n=1 Tax=Albidovulum sediminicola TaxID=2984331 RepID=A0ABT2Z3F1_9RHOB|nr:Flp pilus assembly protein CpaB [Defluviimonas sp. WL0075]MCV2865637.1 Flp pilus assembly protein CpaB [Defluviimonas sp. WL0075]